MASGRILVLIMTLVAHLGVWDTFGCDTRSFKRRVKIGGRRLGNPGRNRDDALAQMIPVHVRRRQL